MMRPHLLFATDRMHVPDDHSGSVQTTHAMVTAMRERGFATEMLATLADGPRYFVASVLYRATLKAVVPEFVDKRAGYPVRRGSQWRFSERVKRACLHGSPDVIVLDSFRQLRILHSDGFHPPCPIVLFVHDVRFLGEGRELPWAGGVTFVANSPFTADRLRQHFGVSPTMIPPLIDFSRYKVERSDRSCITMVSPTQRKGLETTLSAAAALPSQRFLLVEGWPMSDEDWRALVRRTADLPNIELRRSNADMRPVYADTSVLLMPSHVEETFGRVVVEAQINGIPVIARGCGALPWVVGSGGVVLPAEAQDSAWVSALSSLLDSPGELTRVALAAVQNTERPEFTPQKIISALVDVFETACAAKPRAR